MMEDFVVRGLAGGLLLALAAGPLGCLVVWRRMAYFGAALAHSALLGAVLGVLLGWRPDVGVMVLCLVVALAFSALERRPGLSRDTLLGILAHAALALGLVALALTPALRIDLMGYLFGDVLAIGSGDLVVIALVSLVTILALVRFWEPLVLLTVSEDLAAVDGVPVGRMRVLAILLVALVVAAGMRVVGLLLVVALLIVPPAAARPLAGSPRAMALGAALVSALSVGAGMWGSLRWDVPAGPAMVLVAVAAFLLALLISRWRRPAGEAGR